METSYVKEVKRNFRGNLLNYISFLEKEKSGSAQSTARKDHWRKAAGDRSASEGRSLAAAPCPARPRGPE